MELEELKAAWSELNDRAEADRRLLYGVWKEAKLDRARAALTHVCFLPVTELMGNIVAVLLTGAFLADGPHEARFVIPGLVLHVVALLLIGMNVWQIVALARMDYSEPTLEIQRKLAQLRAARLRMNRAIFLLSPLLWTPLAIVGARGWFGVDIYRAFGPLWVASNLAFGALAIPVLIYLARRYNGFLGTIGDDLTGHKLAAARGFVEEIARFERE